MVILFFITISQANAQTKFGINAGLNYSSWKGDAVGGFNDLLEFTDGMITTRGKAGLFVGGFAEMPLGAGFSIQPGVYYSQKGYSLRGEVGGNKLDFLNAGARADFLIRITSTYPWCLKQR